MNKIKAKKLNINETSGGIMKLYPQSLSVLYAPKANKYERDLRIN